MCLVLTITTLDRIKIDKLYFNRENLISYLQLVYLRALYKQSTHKCTHRGEKTSVEDEGCGHEVLFASFGL